MLIPLEIYVFTSYLGAKIQSFCISQVLCKRQDQCCASHHSKEACRPAMETLLSQLRPTSMMLMNPSATMPLIDMKSASASAAIASKSKSHTLPGSRLDHHFSSVAALEEGRSNEQEHCQTLAQNFIYPLNGHHRAMSAPRLLQISQAERDLREKYWGKL